MLFQGEKMVFFKRPQYILSWNGKTLNLGKKTLIMGVLNVTPDSFSDGGEFFDADRALDQAEHMVALGADIIDIGGESTRPFSDSISEEEEIKRIIPIISKLASRKDVLISVDTYKSRVAERALDAGATIINDVSALRFDPKMVQIAAKRGVPVILMHMLGTPKTMQESPHYDAVIGEIISFLEQRIKYAVDNGIKRELIIVDPGIGFGKTVTHNLLIIRGLRAFHTLECPLMIGASRKRFIGKILGQENPHEREIGTGAVTCLSIVGGVHIIRVHNVEHNLQVTRITEAILGAKSHSA